MKKTIRYVANTAWNSILFVVSSMKGKIRTREGHGSEIAFETKHKSWCNDNLYITMLVKHYNFNVWELFSSGIAAAPQDKASKNH